MEAKIDIVRHSLPRSFVFASEIMNEAAGKQLELVLPIFYDFYFILRCLRRLHHFFKLAAIGLSVKLHYCLHLKNLKIFYQFNVFFDLRLKLLIS